MNSPRLEVICVGTELLTGAVNTHVAYLGPVLAGVGLQIAREHSVGDSRILMREVFKESFRRSKIVITSGGLGPTFDDITRDVWSRVVGRPLVLQKNLVSEIERKFRKRGLKMPPANRRQGQVLKGAEVIPNPNGTAPGQFLQIGKRTLVLLPGPARELYPMMEKFVLSRLKSLFPERHLVQKTFLMVGVPESRIDQMIRPVVSRFKNLYGCRVTHGILAAQSIISVKFTVEGKSLDDASLAAQFLSRQVRQRLKGLIFGEDKDTLPGVIGRLLVKRQQTVAVAESCTGGLLGKLITDQPGSSAYFKEGITSYHNESKMKRLRVQRRTLEKFGSVSEQVAREMAGGLRALAKVHYALSVTGVAGPEGGTPEKPVGLVYLGCAGPKRTVIKHFHFVGDRAWIRHRAALMALDILRQELLR